MPGAIIRAALTCVVLVALGCGSPPGTDVTAEEPTMSDAPRHEGIDYIELSVTEMTAAKEFYGGVFGWSFVDYGSDYASFNDGRIDGGLTTVDEVTRGGSLVVFYARDLEALVPRIEQHGGRILKPIFEFPGGRRFHFADPGGNELAVWSDRGVAGE